MHTLLGLHLALTACGGENRLVLGRAPDGGQREPDDSSQEVSGGDSPEKGDAGGRLTVSFQAQGLTGDVIELACGTDCVEAEVLVQGGTPPYTLHWDDGVTGAQRQVCAGEGPFEVSVEDSGNPSVEFGAPRLSTEATLSVNRASCSDAGVKPCRVVTTVRGSAGCNEGGHDTEIRFAEPLAPGRYEFRYEMLSIGEGQFATYALGADCHRVGPEFGRVEFSGAYTKQFAYTCGTLTETTRGLFLDQTPLVVGGAIVEVTTVCEGCPSRGE